MGELKNMCTQVRENVVTTIGTLGVGHIGGSLSIVDLLVVLYEKHMRVDPSNPRMEGRDRLIVSKGHAGPAVYSILAEKGYFDKSWLLTLNQSNTNLPSHCDMHRTPGVDMTTGSLGQGFSCAMGVAKASKLRKDGAFIYTIIGDGESQEGQIWEAAMFAAHQKLDNVIAFTDYNNMQIDGDVNDICDLAPLGDKWRAFGWHTIEVENGHDLDAIDAAINEAKAADKPSMIILKTIKGKGVKFIEEMGYGNHSIPMNAEVMAKALEQVRGAN